MKRAIVTGGAGLIGSGICTDLADHGFEVASFDFSETADVPKGVQPVLCDVSDETSVEEAFALLGWDSLDLLVNNAGIASPNHGPIAQLSLADWRRVTDSHLTGAFLMTRAAVPLMSSGGSIVNMVSTRAFMSEPGYGSLCRVQGRIGRLHPRTCDQPWPENPGQCHRAGLDHQ